MRFIPVLAAALLAAGCAQDSLVLTPAPGTQDSGFFAFHTAGSLVRSGDGRRLVPGEPEAISGELRLPEGRGPFPAVVLAHGCNGNRNVERAWGPVLRGWGYATFVLDSFRGRGIAEVCTDSARLTPAQRIPDAYGALRLLAANRNIDPNRIALMGFSHGGALTMLASTAWAKETYAPAGQPAFRAFFPFYPNCNAEFPERERVSAPLRIHAGELDNWTPAAPCAALAKALKASGQDVEISVYPGAHHAFDQAASYAYLPNVNNGSACFARMASILGPVLSGTSRCVTRGATVAPNPDALAAARQNLHAQLDKLMK
jgi:dienelactone hydrolase